MNDVKFNKKQAIKLLKELKLLLIDNHMADEFILPRSECIRIIDKSLTLKLNEKGEYYSVKSTNNVDTEKLLILFSQTLL